MKLRVFKPAIAVLMVILTAYSTSFAQDISAKPVVAATDSVVVEPVISTDVNVEPLIVVKPLVATVKVNTRALKADLHKLKVQLKGLSVQANAQIAASVKSLTANIDANMVDVSPQISLNFKDGADISYSDDSQDDNELTKNYTKTYPVDGNDAVVIDNRYGSVVVNTWARNEVKVDVQIKVGAGNSSDAQKMLDNVSISDAKNGNSVAFKTNINEMKNSWMSLFKGNSGNHHMEINYTVYMPVKNELVIDNRYGPIVLPDLDGKVTINSAYGSLTAKSLPNQSEIRVKYGNANIGNLGATALDVSYGNLVLGSVDKLEFNVSYSGAKIGKIRQSGSINVKYGDGLQIGDLGRDLKDLAIDASYSNVNVGLSGDENADFAVTVHYGDFNYGDHNVTVTGKDPGDNDRHPHFTRSYKGYIGKGGGGKNIAISNSYGNVKFE